MAKQFEYYYTPASTKFKGGILVSPCPSVHLSICQFVDRIVSALYLQQYSLDPFQIYACHQTNSEGMVFNIEKLKNQ